MKSIVIYNSQTGFTKQYAQWISDTAGSSIAASSGSEIFFAIFSAAENWF
nr:hypothetical protein [uncultured Treponema sp.]